jgi:peptidoglycan/LPS O-acetylase OafA/YrhL
MVLFYFTLASWYYVVSASPKSVSEYMPGESPANISTISLYVAFGFVWLAVLYLTWRGARMGLLAGAAWGLVGVVGAILGFATALFTAPDFSDFLFFPISVVGIVMCAMAWRSRRSRQSF